MVTYAQGSNLDVGQNRASTDTATNVLTDQVTPRKPFKNEVKLNLFSLALGNISLQYERAFTPQFSGAFGFRVGPERALPFASSAKTVFKDDTLAERMIDGARISNYAFTPEIRYYFGKGYTKGFYLGLFGRFGKFSLDVPFTVHDASFAGGQQEFLLKGGYSYGGGGIQMGAKFNLSKRVSLDWFMFGPMVSFGTVSLDVAADLSGMTADGRDETIRELANTFGEATVDDNGIRVSKSLPVPGIRTGLSIGFRF